MGQNKSDYFEYLNECIIKLVDFGWTLPSQVSLAEINNLISFSANQFDVDNFFIKHYSDERKFFWLTKYVCSAEIYSKWYKIIEQCIKSYKNQLYLVTVPALITIIEGVIVSINENNKMNVINLCRQIEENAKDDLEKQAFWKSIGLIIDKLFANIPFDKDRPEIINRHWILHGRDNNEWNQADCLRLFQALETIAFAQKRKN
jgi:hypothetical protein